MTLALVLLSVAAPQSFDPIEATGFELGSVRKGALDDLDGDGDPDVIIGVGFSGQISWIENLGDGRVGPVRGVGFDPLGATLTGIATGDIDGDGDEDVIASYFSVATTTGIRIFQNEGGGRFAISMSPATGPESAGFVHLADMDADGDLDLVGTRDRNVPMWMENDGSGTFAPFTELAAGTSDLFDLLIADLDQDGQLDVVWSTIGGRTYAVRNLGGGSFGERRTVSGAAPQPRSLVVDDIDGDGDFDVLIGSLTLGRLVTAPTEPGFTFSPLQDVISDFAGVTKMELTDVDLDGNKDLIAAVPGSETQFRRGLGGGAFGASISLGAGGNIGLGSADIDGDGDVDPVDFSNAPTWYETVAGTPTAGKPLHYIAGIAQTVDFDADGDLDSLVIDHVADSVGLMENQGDGVFRSPVALLDPIIDLVDTKAIDYDQDGDLDLFVGSGSFGAISAMVDLYENVGGTFAPPQRVYQGIADSGASLRLLDRDGDGDLDLLASHAPFVAGNRTELIWIEVAGGGALNVGASQIASNWRYVSYDDVDGDGLVDAVVISGFTDLLWFRNQGNGEFIVQPSIHSFAQNSVRSLDTGDVDGDGDLDVLVGVEFVGSVELVENLGGTFAAPVQVASFGEFGNVAGFVDADLDGREDVFVLGLDEDEWLRSLPGGGFGAPQPLPAERLRASANSVEGRDIDGDGDLDLIGPGIRRNDLRFGAGYCAALPNSTGRAARVSASGSRSIADDQVTLMAFDMPNQSFGYFLVADAPGFTVPASAAGPLCVGGTIGRLNRQGEVFFTGSTGEAAVRLPVTNVPTPTGAESLVPGDVRYVQAWFRDVNPGTASNFTNGLRVDFR